MPDIAGLQVAVGYDDSAVAAGAARTSQTISGLGSTIQTALGAAAVGAVAGLGAAFVGSVKTAMDFEHQLSAISAVSGATASQLEGIRSVALQLGKDTSFSASEAAAGMEEMVKAGVSLNDVMGGAGRAALDLAAAGGLSVAESATIASNAMNVFSLKGSDMAHVADVIAGAANASAIDVHDFGFSLSAVGAVAATVGLSMEDTATSIAVLGQAGLKGSDAGTSLKTMLLNLNPTSKAATAEMRKLGLITADGANQFFDATGKVKSMSEVAQILQNSMKGLTKEQQINALQVAFGTDAIRAAAIMAKAGAEGFNEMADAESKVTAQSVANERLNNLAGSIEMLKGSLETGAIILGSMFTPALKQMADAMTSAVNTAVDDLQQIPDVIATVQQVIAGDWAPDASIHPFTNAVGESAVMIRDTFGPAIAAVAGFISDTLIPAVQRFAAPIGAFVAGFTGAIAAAGVFSAVAAGVAAVLTMLLSPIGLIAVAVGLLAAAWVTNFGDIRGIVAQLVVIVKQALSGDLRGAFTAFLALLTTTATDIGTQLLAWAQQFVAWVAPLIPPMLAALGTAALALFTWIAAQIPPLLAQLMIWGQQFVDWVAPFIPPLLAALATAAVALLGWIAQQIPPIVAQLLLWAQQFVAWVAPMIPPLLAALATAGAALLAWLMAEIPIIAAQLVVWGQQFAIWVGPASIAMIGQLGVMAGSITRWLVETQLKILAGVTAWATEFGKLGTLATPELAKGLATLFVQIETFFLALPLKMVEWGAEAIKAFIRGFLSVAIPTPRMPSFGGGGTDAQPLSFTGNGSWQATTSGGFANNAERLAFVRAVAAEMGHDPEVVAAVARSEGAGAAGPVGDGGKSFGALQAFTGGGQGNAFMQQTGLDPSDPNNEKALLRWQIGNLGQTGWQPFHGAQAIGVGNFQGINTQAPMPNLRDIQKMMPGSAGAGEPGASPGDWPGFMQQVNEQLPDYLTSLDTIQQAGVGTFSTVGQAGVDQGQMLVSASTDALGNVTRIYTENGVAIGATITDTAGQIVNTWGTMGTETVAQTALMSAGVAEQTNLMATGALTSVTALGTGTLTTVQTTAGTTIATVTDMSGQVTSQYATLANGAQLSMDGLAAGVLTSTTNLGTGVLTIVQDMSGNTIATITDLSGNVTSQYAEMAGAATEMASETSAQFAAVGKAASSTEAPIKHFDDTVKGLKPPDLSGFVSEFKRVEKAANAAADAIATVNGKGGSKGGKSDGGSNIFAKAAGGPVNFGQTYLVGEEGPELFSPRSNGTIIPNHALQGGGGDSVAIHVTINGSLVAERELEDVIASAVSRSLRSGSTGLRR